MSGFEDRVGIEARIRVKLGSKIEVGLGFETQGQGQALGPRSRLVVGVWFQNLVRSGFETYVGSSFRTWVGLGFGTGSG